MIILFSSLLGLMAVKGKKKQIEYVKALIYIGNRVLILLNSTMPETDEIMKTLSGDSELKDFDFSLSNINTYLPYEESARVRSLFEDLGRYDIDSQIYMTEEFTQYFKLKKEQYQEHYNQHYRLYIAFGVLSGVLIAVLFI